MVWPRMALMSKRKINKQQQRRIADIQAKRRKKASRRLRLSDDELANEHLGPEQSGLLLARFYAHVEVEATDGEIFRCHLRQHLPDPVAGDRVIWREGTNQSGVVVAIEPRQSELVRQDRDNQLKPIAANISQMIIVLAPEPPPSSLQVDKFLIAAELLHIQPIIMFNKADISTAQELYKEFKDIYQPLGYDIVLVSAKQQQGLRELEALLQQQTSIFVGQSGVGKSSLLQALIPALDIEIGALSEQSGLGTHTTTTARLYHGDYGGDVIDSPGVRQFSLWPISRQELIAGYREFAPYAEHCHYRNCHHDHETQCAVKQAVKNGTISETRYLNYLSLLQNNPLSQG